MEFGDLRSAARMRDMIERIASKTIDKKRPEVKIGYVNNYDSGRQLAWIKYPGEADDSLVQVRVALNMLPTKTIIADGDDADIVRVAGKPGSYYVTDFVRGVPQDPNNIPLVDVNFANQKGINAADATNPQDLLNLRTGDARYSTPSALSVAIGALTKTSVGLPNVDNTSDADKPVSTPQLNALNLKADDNLVVKLAGTQTITGSKKFDLPIQTTQLATSPGAPGSGVGQIYMKTDGLPYFMNVDGVERPFRDLAIALHANPGLDSWTSGKPDSWHSYWRDTAATPATWTQEMTDKISGVSSMKIVQAVGATGRLLTNEFPVLPGALVSFSLWTKGSGTGARLGISMLTGATVGIADFFQTGMILTPSGADPALTSTWTKYNFSFRVPNGHYFARIDLNPYTYSGVPITVYIDETFSSYQTTGGATGVEVGTLNMWPLSTPPPGYLACDGSTPLIVDYPALAALLGTTFGGNGTTTFGLPDMRGRFPLGAGTFAALNANEGLAENLRTPSHKHTMTHTHTINHNHADTFALAKTMASNTVATGGSDRVVAVSLTGTVTAFSGNSGASSAANTGNQPNTGADAIPFLGINFIIKT